MLLVVLNLNQLYPRKFVPNANFNQEDVKSTDFKY
uniref:Uncharacterized protein n=1 Tax=Anguilla anguilla TaxID=7936 RepID=A0A0E9SN36_ANGAN